jgi:hypothetical protein
MKKGKERKMTKIIFRALGGANGEWDSDKIHAREIFHFSKHKIDVDWNWMKKLSILWALKSPTGSHHVMCGSKMRNGTGYASFSTRVTHFIMIWCSNDSRRLQQRIAIDLFSF